MRLLTISLLGVACIATIQWILCSSMTQRQLQDAEAVQRAAREALQECELKTSGKASERERVQVQLETCEHRLRDRDKDSTAAQAACGKAETDLAEARASLAEAEAEKQRLVTRVGLSTRYTEFLQRVRPPVSVPSDTKGFSYMLAPRFPVPPSAVSSTVYNHEHSTATSHVGVHAPRQPRLGQFSLEVSAQRFPRSRNVSGESRDAITAVRRRALRR